MAVRPRLHVEIAMEARSNAPRAILVSLTEDLLLLLDHVKPGATLTPSNFPENSRLHSHVRSVQICDAQHDPSSLLRPTAVDYVYHVYKLEETGPASDTAHDAEGGESTPPSKHWSLPAQEFFGLWESLVFDMGVKDELLRFVETAAYFADMKVDSNIINWNRVVLLHGPPGTGKTSLCKALAQKLSIRLDNRYQRTEMVEINSHSLFSKWFSESGKLVLKLFNRIKEVAEDVDTLVCVLIDEVESLTHARKASMNGVEPSDSIRVVNAVLTQIDQIQRYPNVLILTTSNMTEAIDLAFVDRADIKRYIGLPSTRTIYQIYQSCLDELMGKRILSPQEHIFPYTTLEACQFSSNTDTKNSLALLEIAEQSKGLSGRSLRKVPFLAYALHMHREQGTFEEMLWAMLTVINERKTEEKMNRLDNEFENSVKIQDKGQVNGV